MATASRLRAAASAGGLRFECYLPPDLADWLMEKIARGVFSSPSEAVFEMPCEQLELDRHNDLRN
jgi:hypothetical protein